MFMSWLFQYGPKKMLINRKKSDKKFDL